ncbi:hypothetical protein B0F90DRAFT_1679590 [Multifurca ochricompacta]|uniref:Uncharacterized protein n=1 Tax=Multifurca ochricompacta TaxID=376703 RepID=A0AAD4MCV6_9AGAM|nr:hypothetical protein B0F90DRAFT_1679590 [Multifurca ochricompacta]
MQVAARCVMGGPTPTWWSARGVLARPSLHVLCASLPILPTTLYIPVSRLLTALDG